MDQHAGAICVALQHASVNSEDAAMLCRLAQACSSWRSAVQQAGPGAAAVTISSAPAAATLPARLASLARWLPKHAALVGSLHISISNQPANDAEAQQLAAYQTLAEPLLASSLHTAALNGHAAGASSLPLLRLSSYSSNFLHSPALLSALPAATLTQLVVEFQRCSGGMHPRAAFAAALGRLTNLRQLTLSSDRHDDRQYRSFPAAYLQGVAQLSQLTELELEGFARASDMQLLPVSLQKLVLLAGPARRYFVEVDHLTNLRSLVVEYESSIPESVVPPLQLQDLIVTHIRDIYWEGDESSLPQLQRLKAAMVMEEDEELLLQLQPALPQLTHLELTLNVPNDATGEAIPFNSIGQFSQLRSLRLDTHECTSRQITGAVQGVAAVSSLTRLGLWLSCCTWSPVHMFEALKGMTGLQALDVCGLGSRLVPDEAMHLTTLTKLTQLHLSECGAAVGDTAAVALAVALTQLQDLDLFGCRISSTSPLPAIGHLPNLRTLNLVNNPGFATEQAIMMLSGLTQLTKLARNGRGQYVQPPQQAYDRFWAAVRDQQQQQQQQ